MLMKRLRIKPSSDFFVFYGDKKLDARMDERLGSIDALHRSSHDGALRICYAERRVFCIGKQRYLKEEEQKRIEAERADKQKRFFGTTDDAGVGGDDDAAPGG